MLGSRARGAGAVAALAIALAGCGGVGDPSVAATVNGEPIARSTLAHRYEAVASNPQLAERLRADEGGQLRGRVQAQVLTELVASTLVRQGAAELGVAIDEADVAAQRDRLAGQLGGEDALQQAAARQGLSDADLRRLLRDRAYRQAITAELAGDDAAGQQASQAFTEWLTRRRDQADIAVNPEFGQWDAAAGSVVAHAQGANKAAPDQPARPGPGAGAEQGRQGAAGSDTRSGGDGQGP